MRAKAIASGALRGLKDTRLPMILAAIGYWVVGFPVAWVLGLHTSMGARGIWVGLALSLATAAVLLVGRFWLLSARAISLQASTDAVSGAVAG